MNLTLAKISLIIIQLVSKLAINCNLGTLNTGIICCQLLVSFTTVMQIDKI